MMALVENEAVEMFPQIPAVCFNPQAKTQLIYRAATRETTPAASNPATRLARKWSRSAPLYSAATHHSCTNPKALASNSTEYAVLAWCTSESIDSSAPK